MTCSETAVRVNTGIQRTLRSSSSSNKLDEEEVALEKAEEKLMAEEEDEEIESCDESGKPVVDTEKLERRMMTVALVKSVVETSGGGSNGSSGVAKAPSEADKQQQQHTYGLRKRSSKSSRDSSDEDEPRPTRRARKTQPIKKRSVPKGKKYGNSSSKTVGKLENNGPISQGLQSTQQVPNPLLSKVNPAPQRPAQHPGAPAVASSSTMPPVPCPLPANATSGTVKANESGAAAKRGRIFSIDIDPEGLEFPDINIDVSMQPNHPGARIRSASIEQASQADSSKSTSVTFKPQGAGEHKDSLDVSLPSTRGRAMSFEFFSFGINADEPLPPAPVISGTEVVAPAFQRPRGDSIIFEPDSFRDGGVLEEHALIKGRTASIDISAPEELALMNTPGFAPAPTTVPDGKPKGTKGGTAKHPGGSRRSHASQAPTATSSKNNMSSLASTLNNEAPSHTSFQMDLLNKDGRIGIYLPEARKARIAKFHSKRKMRIWRKRIKYDCRKKLADSRPRIKGRFVKRSDKDE